jgi:hypothetical protein
MLLSNVYDRVSQPAAVKFAHLPRWPKFPVLTASRAVCWRMYSQEPVAEGSARPPVARRQMGVFDRPVEVVLVDGPDSFCRTRAMSRVLQFLAKRESSGMWSNGEAPKNCYILRATRQKSFDLRLRTVVTDVHFSETRFVALESPDDRSQCLFSTAVQIARLVARGVIVVCAVDLSHQTAKTLKFAMETLGISLSRIHLKFKAESWHFNMPVAKYRRQCITRMPESAFASAPAFSPPTPVGRSLIRYLATRNQTGNARRDHADDVVRSQVDAYAVMPRTADMEIP